MNKKNLRTSKLRLRLRIIKMFFEIMGVKPIHIILPVILSFIVASVDGISIGLMVPLAKGMVSDFRFTQEIPILNHFIGFLGGFSKSSSNRTIFLILIVAVFLFVVLKNIVGYINSLISSFWHGKFKTRVYNFVFNRFLNFGKMFFDRTNQGYLSMTLNYSDKVMEILELFERSVNNFFTLSVYFIIMLAISWKLTLITVVVFPLLHYSLRLLIIRLNHIATLRNEAWIGLNRNVFNILSCIPLIKAYSKEEATKNQFAQINEELRFLDYSSAKAYKLIVPIQELIVTVSLLIMVSVVALLLGNNKASEISVFVVFFYAARKSLPMFNIFNDIKASLAMAKAPLKELYKILDDKDKFYVTEGEKFFPELKKEVVFSGLNFSYITEIPILKNLSFCIEKGKVTAIVGPTGSGKTTIISVLMRFYDCPPASIMIDGEDLRNFTIKSFRDHIALVSQEVLLFNDSLRNNIIFGLDRNVEEEELIKIAKKARIYDFVLRLPSGFDSEIGDRGVKLSGGEKQRVAIARALLKGSEILILDEATSSLDSMTERLIQEAIDEAMEGKTAIVIAHRLSTIKNADKILVIENGQLIEEGSLADLLQKKGKFYEYWETQKFH